MSGHIRARGKNIWLVVAELPPDPLTGKRRQQAMTFHGNKKDAEKKLRDVLHEIESGGYVKPERLSVAEYLERWLRDYAETNTRPRTAMAYRQIVRQYVAPYLGNIQLHQLGPEQIQGAYSRLMERGLSAQTVLHAHRVLRKALADAVHWRVLAVNPADAVRPPRPMPKAMQALDAPGVKKLLEAMSESPYRHFFQLALYTGMRRGELVGLTWGAVDLDGGSLAVTQSLQRIAGRGVVSSAPKTAKSRRRVALSPDAVAIIKAQHAQQAEQILRMGRDLWPKSEWVFTQANGDPLNPDRVSQAFHLLAGAAGFEGLRLHDLRHTHATLMMAAGVHPKIVSERLGHSNISITLDIYSHTLPGLQEAAARAFDEGLKESEAVYVVS